MDIRSSRLLRTILGAGLVSVASAASAAPRVEAIAMFKGSAVVQINGTQRNLRVGETSPEGCQLLTATSQSATMQCGGQRMQLSLSHQVGGNYADVAKTAVRVVADNRGQYWVRGTINGQSVDMLIDTGATVVALSGDRAAMLGIQIPANAQRGYVQTAQGRAESTLVNVDSIDIGGITTHNVQAAVVSGNYPQQILLGMSFLKTVTMENLAGVMVLTRR